MKRHAKSVMPPIAGPFAGLLDSFDAADAAAVERLRHTWRAKPAVWAAAHLLTHEVGSRFRLCAALRSAQRLAAVFPFADLAQLGTQIAATHGPLGPNNTLAAPLAHLARATEQVATVQHQLDVVLVMDAACLDAAWREFGHTIHAPVEAWITAWQPQAMLWRKELTTDSPAQVDAAQVQRVHASLLAAWTRLQKGDA